MLKIILIAVLIIYLILILIATLSNESGKIDEGNMYLAPSPSHPSSYVKKSIYELIFKPLLDNLLSFSGLVILSPFLLILSIIIIIDDPGPVLFAQKRVGKDKHFFRLHKFRSMKMSAPHNIPTHQLQNPEQYITKVGRFLRKTSLDELPQLWDVFRGKMSFVSPRPALWNQDDLVAERDIYGANSVRPGLTGWAQINGRDELEIPVKARLDGDYIARLRKNSFSGLCMDLKCFFGTFVSVLKSDGVVEGGTGAMGADVGRGESAGERGDVRGGGSAL